MSKQLSLLLILTLPSPAYWGQTGVMRSQPAQFSPRSETPMSLGAGGPIGACHIGDITVVPDGVFMCLAQNWQEEQPWKPNPKYKWA